MMDFDWKNIEIYDDDLDDMDIIKKIIGRNDQDDPFYIFDVEDIVKKHKQWLTKMPRIVPHFAVKSNPDPTVIKILAALNASFDCASMQEIQLVMNMGVTNDRIIYANPIKAPSHIEFAKKVGVDRTVVDTKEEVLKLKELHPNAKLLIRIAIDGSAEKCGVNFSGKFGCKSTDEAIELMKFIKIQKMYLLGFSFHLGSPCWDTTSYGKGIEICKDLIKTARDMGHLETRLIDIGGGIDGTDKDYFNEVAASVNAALEDVDPSIEIISEPGRYYVDTSFTLSARIIGKKIINQEKMKKKIYYINEGTYGSFIEELLDLRQRIPISLYNQPSDEKFPSVIWGRTCDSCDVVIKNELMQDFNIDDWMIWRNMGAYTISNATVFNGYTLAGVKPFIRKGSL
ncbi:hypothetical protein HCN44_011191 [Aphidius gifuensis]|uniref:Orn/DAP/Arg decarboxylase 2 N-terminal domain-containing protein n=2 Tax=Aphidius gifuensis TaxID=684658 RepID=A0A834XYC7_APHGI|nr:hypothetical protein HCN44_011191 [Aphidius gifuensis]